MHKSYFENVAFKHRFIIHFSNFKEHLKAATFLESLAFKILQLGY